MNLPIGEQERIRREIRLHKVWAARKEVLAAWQLKLPNFPVNALTPQLFEVYAAYEWIACNEYEKVYKDMTLRYDAFIAQEVAKGAEVEKNRRAKISSTIPSSSPHSESRRPLTTASCISKFGNPPLLDGGGTENMWKETEETEPEEEMRIWKGRGWSSSGSSKSESSSCRSSW